jgi:hypothetical protein
VRLGAGKIGNMNGLNSFLERDQVDRWAKAQHQGGRGRKRKRHEVSDSTVEQAGPLAAFLKRPAGKDK